MTVGKIPHAIERALERYGVLLTWADLKRLEDDCKAGRSLVMQRWPDGGSKNAVLHKDVALVVVIGPDGRIKTVLPRDAARQSKSSYRRGGRTMSVPDAVSIEQLRGAKELFDSAVPLDGAARVWALPLPPDLLDRSLRAERMQRAREASGWPAVEIWRLEEAGLLRLLPCHDDGDHPLLLGELGVFYGLTFERAR